MAIVFGAICPHPPLLLPTIGKEQAEKLQQTKQAFKKLEEELYLAKPDTILIISPHGIISPEIFHLNLAEKFYSNLGDFGDFKTKLEKQGDIALASTIKQAAEIEDVPVSTISNQELDHGTVIPLYFLTQHLENTKILPVSYSLLSLEEHYNFGKFLYRELIRNSKRVAIVASGDLSHRLSENSPAGFSALGEKFDTTLKSLLKAKDSVGILNLDPNLICESGECGLRSILILLGIFSELNYNPEILSYEAPFGIGYLVANLSLT